MNLGGVVTHTLVASQVSIARVSCRLANIMWRELALLLSFGWTTTTKSVDTALQSR